MATIITPIDPITLESQIYSSQDIGALSPETVSPVFDPNIDYVEYTVSSPDKSFQITDQNLEGFIITNTAAGTGVAFSIDLNPEEDLRNKGFSNGSYITLYKFLRNQLNSSSDTRPYFIKEISPDRTELKLSSNTITNDELISLISNFKLLTNSAEYFQDFYLNFGGNNLVIANNILLDNTKTTYDILINLYEPLPSRYKLKDVLWIVTQTADPLAFNIQFQPEVITPQITALSLKSPNFDLSIKDKTNNSTDYINYEQLLTTNLVSSYDQILSYLAEKSINIGIDYTDFSNFVHFSSIESRVKNFLYKVQLIEQYTNTLNLITPINSATPSSVNILQEKISEVTKNFDGFEYYLYYSSGSNTYPKSTTSPPYTLLTSSNATVTTWYNNLIESASFYDAINKDYLINTIPSYLTDDPQNDPYKVFIDMIGQYYDNIWIYYKDVTNRYNGDNRLEYGISKDLVADAIRSFGLKIYQNNFSVSDLFDAFTGFNPGSINRTTNPEPCAPDTEQISDYKFTSPQSLYTPIDDVNKEMYKRIYHNLPYLLKSKGTVAGLQNIISMFGITSSILSVKEFGGEWNSTKPVTGIKDIINDNIQILTSAQISQSFFPLLNPDYNDPTQADYAFIPKFVLSNQKSILRNYYPPKSLSPSVNTIEITFSPQNDIDNYIIDAFSPSTFDIGTYIGNPTQTFLPYYPNLQERATSILVNNDLSPITYIRLIKYFDNSLFNMIKDFVPARTNLKSGITIKPHLLERSKIVQPQVFFSSSIYTGSIDTAFIEGGTGGTFNDFNSLLPRLNNTQSWYQDILTPLGLTQSFHTDQAEFYNGELPYYPTEAFTADGELNPNNPYKFASAPSLADAPFYTVLYTYSNNQTLSEFINNVIPSDSGIRAWVNRQIIPVPTDEYGVYNRETIFTIEYLKINPISSGNDFSDVLSALNYITIPYYFGTGFYWITVEVGTPYLDDGGNWNYPTVPALIPTDTIAFPSNGYVTFVPSVGERLIPWDYNENNPIISNAFNNLTSTHYMEAEFTNGVLTPTNFDLLISLSASKALIQDSNYSSDAWSNIRYNGSRITSRDFNIPFN
jgi:hypothetical protein